LNEPSDILKKYWGFGQFRSMQEDIIQSVLDGKDTLALLPTGGGKSICFQVPGLILDGLCLVISPLIALMKDQVMQLKKRGIQAAALYSGMPSREIDIVLDNCVHGQVKFLYVSPERLQSDLFAARVKKMKVDLLAIDEAHCISQWGYDFRPAYLTISEIYELLGPVKKIALTATATNKVREDICEKLQFAEPSIFQKSFARKNLSYSVFNLENKSAKLLEILNNVKGSAIVYVRSRKETQKITSFLYQNGISADFYHAGLDTKARSKKQEDWIGNHRRVMVSTNAFGMGIDKPDVRIVVHYGLPDSLEAYYQEAGRAGRDGKSAYAVMLMNQSNLEMLKEQAINRSPDLNFIKRVYQSIANFYKLAVGSSQWQNFDFELAKFVKTYNLPPYKTHFAVKKLEEMGLVLLNESLGKSSTLKFAISHEALYKYDISNAKMEPLIKGLLRLYGGQLYVELVNINEYDLAKMAKTTHKDVVQKLTYLHQNEIAIYHPVKRHPQLTFLTPRLPVDVLKSHYQGIRERAKTVDAQLKSIMAYANNPDTCRTRTFQEYFGESAYLNCGVCDVCIKNKKAAKFQESLDNRAKSILVLLKAQACSLPQLKSKLNATDEFLFTEAVRQLMDEGRVILTGSKLKLADL